MKTSKASAIALLDKRGRIFLQHRDKYAPRHPNYWSLFGGFMEKGESPEETIRRETREELGIELKGLKFFKEYEFKNRNLLKKRFIFVASLNFSLKKLKKQQKEGQNLGLFSFKELPNLKISNNNRKILNDLFNR